MQDASGYISPWNYVEGGVTLVVLLLSFSKVSFHKVEETCVIVNADSWVFDDG